MKNVTLTVSDMKCDGCASRVHAALKGVEGVRRVEVSLDEEQAAVLAEDATDPQRLAAAVEEAGYGASPA